jgi:acetolactate synthase regulatory subunit
MSHTLLVRLKRAEGSLVRLLGQIGRRGYEVLGVTAKVTADRTAFDVVLEFEPILPAPPAPPQPRPAEVLPALVAKLVDVEKVELRGAAPRSSAEAPGNGTPPGSPTQTAAAKPAGDLHWEE